MGDPEDQASRLDGSASDGFDRKMDAGDPVSERGQGDHDVFLAEG
jgi:hypothetical protein